MDGTFNRGNKHCGASLRTVSPLLERGIGEARLNHLCFRPFLLFVASKLDCAPVTQRFWPWCLLPQQELGLGLAMGGFFTLVFLHFLSPPPHSWFF